MRLKLSVTSAVEQWFNNLGKRPALAVMVSILWLSLIGWVAFGWNLGSIGLIDETEPLFAEASRQMFVTGDWITPFFNGETRFDKPVLIYWCQAIAYAIIGVNEWAVRLSSAIAAMGVISLAFYTVQWCLAKQDELEKVSRSTRRYLTAFVASAMMALNPEMIIWGRTGVSDMLLTGCMASALLCFFLGYAGKGSTQDWGLGIREEFFQSRSEITSPFPNKWYLACYVLIAAAILAKGPVGIVLPGLIIAAFLLYLGKLREVLREMRPLIGILIIFGLSAPWYALVTWRNGWSYINSFFGYHNLERFTGVVNHHSAPWYYYFLVVLLGFAPYSVYLPIAITRLKFWQRSHWRLQERSQQLGLFAWFWFAGIFGFFSIAVTKLPSYVLPLMPAAAILVALLWSDFFQATKAKQTILSPSFHPPSPSPFLRVSGWVNVVFLSFLAVGMFNLSQLLGRDPAIPNFRILIQKSGLPVTGGVIWLVCAVLVAGLLLNRRWNYIININLLGFVAFLIVVLTPAMFFIDRERQLPLRELSVIALQSKQPNEELVMMGFKKPSVTFYSQTQVNYLRFPQEVVKHIQNEAAKTPQPPSLLLLAEQKKFLKMNLEPDDYKNLATKGAYNLIRVPFKKRKNQKLDISFDVH
ncbi:ArnT family glycosyltransferase [aff. Roholtiella sp. LEGE 12411]|uniref:ArnT family glycosyltransferase n=1 Tax=aff. Roholtiella sp. LEGE 12411 TaxID=1828822 RepID=UPI001881F325|nr:glycosyltransferase family 39 protein [aff. Roholtiella sp. LEGE 12411]MBE9036735.1 glycosyltransferase family 39 protein [aff. Roholtiella sp. LEGE 12411]